MPNITLTPATLAWGGGSLVVEPVRVDIAPAGATWAGGIVAAGPGDGTALNVVSVALDRLRRFDDVVTKERNPTQRFQLIWQRTMEAIEAAFAALGQQVGDNTTLIAQIQAAQALAQAANDRAEEAERKINLADSYTEPANVLTAASNGTITVAPHNRVYADGAIVAIDGGSLAGFDAGDFVRVYYDDAAREGGAVAYGGTTGEVVQQGDRHVVGGASIPAEGEVDVTGAGIIAPGYIVPPNLYLR